MISRKMKMIFVLTGALILFVANQGRAGLITWTGSENNSWHNAANWDPQQVPVDGDEVEIPSGTPSMHLFNWHDKPL